MLNGRKLFVIFCTIFLIVFVGFFLFLPKFSSSVESSFLGKSISGFAVLRSNDVYNTSSNITSENSFSHINLSDGSLMGYWSFDVNTSGITYDYSNSSNDGNLTSTIWNSTGGVYGSGGYQFDGVSSEIDLDPFGTLDYGGQSEITITAWIKRSSDAGQGGGGKYTVIWRGYNPGTAFNSDINLRLLNADEIEMYLRTEGAEGNLTTTTSPITNIDTWYFVAFTYSSTDHTARLYVNGNQEAITTTPFSGNLSNYGLETGPNDTLASIGRMNVSEGYRNEFDGSIDEIGAWTRRLSTTEVQQIYNATYGRFMHTGEMNFNDYNLSVNTVNIFIPNCQQYNGSTISFKINSGSYQALNSTCAYNGYSFPGSSTSANLTLQLNSSATNFYSPVVAGNISLSEVVNDTTPPNGTNNFSSDSSGNDWLMFHQYLNHTAWDGETFPVIQGLNNAYYTTANVIYSSPTVAKGYVYITSYDGNFYQLNASNVTQLVHSFVSGGYVYPSITVVGDYAYSGSGSNKFYQLNASDISQEITHYTAESTIETSAAISGGYAYFGSYDHKVYQVNATNVSQLIASYTTGDIVFASPAVANGYVYVGSEDNKTYQLNATNISQVIATFQGNGLFRDSSPAVWNGSVYIGNEDGNLYQLNATNISQEITHFTTDGQIRDTAPAIWNGYVYITGSGGTFYQLNATNVSQEIATYGLQNYDYSSSPAVANGYVYIGSYDGNVYQLNASNVSQKSSSYNIGEYTRSSPAVANGYVYIGANDYRLYQLNASNISLSNNFPDVLPQKLGINTNITSEYNFSHLSLTDNSLIYYNPFDVNSSGTTYDYSGNSLDGNLSNLTWISSGYIGGAYNFTGLNSYIQFPNVSSLQMETKNFTFSAWIHPAAYPSDWSGIIGGERGGASLGLQTDGSLRLTKINYADAPDSSLIATLNQWSFVAVTYDNSGTTNNLVYYLNGNPQTYSWNVDFDVGSPSNGLGYRKAISDFFNGEIDEVMIWNRVLNSTEISQVYSHFLE